MSEILSSEYFRRYLRFFSNKTWMEGFSVSHRLQSGEGRPRLEAIFRGETRSRESPPVPAVQDVAVEMCVPVVKVVGVRCHPSFLLRFCPVCRTGDEEWATLVLLKEILDTSQPFVSTGSQYDYKTMNHHTACYTLNQ